jgi:2-polyprenyl-3-methyl-5-hydroxy-6-metoxy-1,4-benzoquinol methylase
MNKKNESVASHYDGSAENYHLQYERELLADTTRDYPANYFRMHLLINSFVKNGLKNVVEIGVGEGTPLVQLAKAGMKVSGVDISRSMVEKAKGNFKNNGLDPNLISWGDIQDPMTYNHLLDAGQYDGLLAMGVMPHVHNDEFVLSNMKNMVKPGGKVFIEFRNKLFSLFTFNRYTKEFILDDLLRGVSNELKQLVSADLDKRLEMDKPTPRLSGSSDGSNKGDFVGYDAILSKFHNPFEVQSLFKKLGFSDVNFLWYHYHPAMPFISEESEELFRNEALRLEHDVSGWRGFFLCSAFVIEATVSE